MAAAIDPRLRVRNPFGKLIGLRIDAAREGSCRSWLEAGAQHHNPHAVLHGGVLFSLADSSMGAALYTLLDEGESCATVEMKMNFLRPVHHGRLDCETTVLRRGRSTAVLESRIRHGAELVAVALGTYAVFPRAAPGEEPAGAPAPEEPA